MMKSDLPDRTAAAVSRPDQGSDAYFPPPAYGYGGGGGMASNDPRTSSAQSLVPSLPEYEEIARRTLLIVYIHGFMGNDTSFQSFPAHVHRYLRDALAETHVIHSKIYPRYKTYKALEVARDNFSSWLQPHESANTDVVLVGHSMGGLLAAEVALMPTWNSQDPRFFQHRILGTVQLDAPLLGLHPGIVVSGISSLFRPKPDGPTPQEGPGGSSQNAAGMQSPDAASIYSDPSSPAAAPTASPALPHATTLDPNFNPEFPNDVRLQDRGFWKNVVHFVKKHNQEGLVDAATSHIMSHLEFGSVLMEFNNLKLRYENIRKLEDVNDVNNYGSPNVPPQVRFVQYYTVCHGYPKKPKTPSQGKSIDATESSGALNGDQGSRLSLSRGSTGGPSLQDREQQTSSHLDVPHKEDAALEGSDGSRSASSLEFVDPEPIEDDEDHESGTAKESQAPPALPPRQASQAAEPATSEAQDGAKKNSVEVNDEQKSDTGPPVGTEGDDAASTTPTQEEGDAFEANLPAVPELPEKPAPFEPEKFPDKDARKQAEKEAKRAQKAYEQAVKNRDKTIKERQKIVEKRKKKAASEAEKKEKEEQKRKKAEQKAEQKQRQKSEDVVTALEAGVVERAVETQNSLADAGAAAAPAPPSRPAPSPLEPDPATPLSPGGGGEEEGGRKKAAKPPKPPKERKFINLPSKVNGQVDAKWVKIFMADTDEVGAHTGLFFPGAHYEKLVGDVGDMILGWVHDDATKKTILGLP